MSIMAKHIMSVPEYFAGQNIFITGGSGYMGKCLIEKLLRSCPEVGNIYILVRPKRGESIEDRCKKIMDDVVFSKLKETNASALKKIIPLSGDIEKLKLGLSEEDKETIISKVSIVYHVAATIKFDHPLREAIFINTRGTREVCDLVLQIKNISAFVHVSTAYCQCDKTIIEEKLYPAPADWRKTIQVAETLNSDLLNLLSNKYKGNLPNTYTFSKSLGEHVVNDLCNGKVPTVIYRPSIVFPADKEPIPGFMDNFNGPMGLMVGLGKGLIRTTLAAPDTKMSYIPIDIATKGMILSTWDKGCENKNKINPISWYSASGNNILAVSNKELYDTGRKLFKSTTTKEIWYSVLHENTSEQILTTNFNIYFIQFILCQVIPALIADLLVKVLRMPPYNFMKIQRKIYIGSQAIQFFSQNEWDISNDNFLRLDRQLLDNDKADFSYNISELNFRSFLLNIANYYESNFFKTNLKEYAKVQKSETRKLWIAHTLVLSIWYMLLAGLVYIIFLKYCR